MVQSLVVFNGYNSLRIVDSRRLSCRSTRNSHPVRPRLMMTCSNSVLLLLLVSCLVSIESAPFSWGKSWTLDGQALELISREDTRSPFFDATASRQDVLASSIARSWNRLRALNKRIALSGSPQEESGWSSAQVSSFEQNLKSPAGGVVTSPPSTSAQEYFVSLQIGTPAREVLLTIDTGSEVSWVQCTPCVYCYNQLLPLYNPSLSSSHVRLDCQNLKCNSTGGVLAFCSPGDGSCAYETAYGDGSVSIGTLSSETFTFKYEDGGSVAVPKIIFGCGRFNQGLFIGNSGLLGLDRGKFSFARQLRDVFGQKFTLCYTDRVQKPNASSVLFFGETDTQGLAYSPLQSSAGSTDLYYLKFLGISVGSTRLKIDPAVLQLKSNGTGGTVIDSGTYITFLPDIAYTPLQSTFKNLSKLSVAPPSNSTLGLDFCFNFASFPPAKVPTITFHLEDVDLVFDESNIFIGPFDTRGELYCFAFVNSGPIAGSIAVLIGNVQQQNFRIEYDLKQSRIGFQKKDCSAS